MVDDHVRAEGAGERFGLARGDRGERRTLLGPDLAIGAGRAARPRGKDDAAQDRLPDELRDLDDARVGEEFLEVAPDRARLRRFGGAEMIESEEAPRSARRAR